MTCLLNRRRAATLLMILCLSACSGADEKAASNVTMRDMEVIDGTANDAMVDLDNVVQDIAPMTNAADMLDNAGASANASAGAAVLSNESDPPKARARADKAAPAGDNEPKE